MGEGGREVFGFDLRERREEGRSGEGERKVFDGRPRYCRAAVTIPSKTAVNGIRCSPIERIVHVQRGSSYN